MTNTPTPLVRLPAAGRFAALEHAFTITMEDAELGEYLASILQPLEADEGPATAYELTERSENGYDQTVVRCDGAEIAISRSPSLALGQLLWQINRSVLDTSQQLLLHASAAELNGRAVICPAPAESGKSTLVAGLVRAGMGYLTDEAVAVDRDTGWILPYPKPIGIDPGSYHVLSDLLPELSPSLLKWFVDQIPLGPTAIRPDAVGRTAPAVALITPRYVADAETTLTPIHRADGLMVAAENCFNMPIRGRDGFSTAARLVRGCACYELTVGDLDDAVTTVLAVLDEIAAP